MNTNNTQQRFTAPVADEPSSNAATYAEVIRDAEVVSTGGPFVDADTPEGHFGIIVRNLGGVQTYWFRGALGDPDARIAGRVQIIEGRPTYYVGGSIFGGELTFPQRTEAR